MFCNVKKEEKYNLLTPLNENSEKLLDDFKSLKIERNTILDCSDITFSSAFITIFSNKYHDCVARSISFIVVVSDKMKIEELEEQFVVVPTISEAIDYIYMEELERNL